MTNLIAFCVVEWVTSRLVYDIVVQDSFYGKLKQIIDDCFS